MYIFDKLVDSGWIYHCHVSYST